MQKLNSQQLKIICSLDYVLYHVYMQSELHTYAISMLYFKVYARCSSSYLTGENCNAECSEVHMYLML